MMALYHHPKIKEDWILGYVNMGIVDQVGSGVTWLKKGDKLVMPFNVADGRCLDCEEDNTAYRTGVSLVASRLCSRFCSLIA